MKNTKHCLKRMSQRGIKDKHILFLLENGSINYAPGGLKKFTMTRKNVQEAISKLKKEIQILSNLPGLTAIVDQETVITVYKAH